MANTPTKPPLRRTSYALDPWRGESPAHRDPSASPAKAIWSHLPSKAGVSSTPTRKELPAIKGKRWS